VQVLPRYTIICIKLKKYDIETLPFLSSYNTATIVYSKELIQPPSPLLQ